MVTLLEKWEASCRRGGYVPVHKESLPEGTLYIAEKLCDPLPDADPKDPQQGRRHFHMLWLLYRGMRNDVARHLRISAVHWPFLKDRLIFVYKDVADFLKMRAKA